MEFINAQARQAYQRLRGMTVSQRAAIVLLVIVLLGGMWGLVRWGGELEWSPLLDQSFSADEIQRVQSELRMAGIASKVSGDRVMIRGGDDARQQVQALLSQRGALPADTSLGYAALIKENSVFVGEQRSRWMEYRGLEAELSAVLRRFDGVKDARVLVTVPQRRGFSRNETASSASVALTVADGQALDKQRVQAVANFVAGAVPGLQLSNIKITDGLRFYRPPDATEQLPTEMLDQQQRVEDHYMQKIYDQLRHIEGVVVNVHAKLRSSTERMQQETYGPPVLDRETSTTEEMQNASRAAEPSVRPNTRVGLADSAGGSTSTKEETDSSFNNKRDVKMKVVDELRGSVDKLLASVSVPRHYLERIVGAGKDKKIDEAAFEKVATTELARIRALVKPLIDAAGEDQVVVDWYYDEPDDSQPRAEVAESTYMAMARAYGWQGGLLLLALMSLMIVWRIARKAQGSVTKRAGARRAAGAVGPTGAWSPEGGVAYVSGPGPDELPLPHLTGGQRTVGEAQELQGVMVAHEVDEETVRTQQIVNQIGQLVQEDASIASSIVQQWLEDEE